MPTRIATRSSAGSAPTIILPPTITGSAVLAQTLTCNPGVWAGFMPVAVTRQWFRENTPIAGETGLTHLIVAGDQTHALRCVETGSNLLGANTASSVLTATIP